MTQAEYQATAIVMYRKSSNMRGQVLDGVIYIERFIDDYLAWYFSGNDKQRVDLLNLVFSVKETPFDFKRQIFEFIIERDYNDTYIANKQVFKNIEYIMKERNILAHYLLDTSEAGIDKFIATKELEFVKFKGKTENIEYKDEKFDSLKKRIESTRKAIESMTQGKVR
ncbi:MAG: hypothetical protein JWQ09_948 [Segetibacter sp.]|nr:hypothetical protein [Segetibacter sp.]